MGWLDGYVTIVTGGGAGIGRAVVRRFVEEGARVVVLERVPDRVEELKQELGSNGSAVQGSSAELADNERVVAETVKAFGKLDVFVGNAAIFDSMTTLVDLPRETIGQAFDELFAVNVKGYLFGAKAAVDELQKTGGSIIYTVSNAGFYPAGGGPLYTMSKHAVVGLIRQLAYELAPTIRVNGLAPGGTLTDLRGLQALGTADQSSYSRVGADVMEQALRSGNPLEQAAHPEDHAGGYVYLASRENSVAVTGHVVESTGGIGVRGFTRGIRATQSR
ncbi:MAG TPA: 3-(cis-5,6-dihydroxycyclohexa-1,3-dien-1-yl)propanoate dehydrogenase [Dehalococcoidia bacterium]|nr:3-(cis-5,6-dihydroxycyclohexa-1,3-dien-1-yl)propanoate dehydrogenase [Dehalococcoidia bacterium]